MNLSSGTARQVFNSIHTLPPVPRIAQEILSLKINTIEGERALLQVIEKDPPILSKIIGLSNSPLLGTSRTILSLHDAVALLGVKRIKMIALSCAMMSSLSRKPAGLLNIDGLWKHSLAVALTMDTLAGYMADQFRPADDGIYLAGLLHDIGFMLLDYVDPVLSDRFHARLAENPQRLVEEVEAEMLKMNHCELGTELATYWGLPESVISVIQFHHASRTEPAYLDNKLVAMANLAEKLLPTFGIAEAVTIRIEVEEWQRLGIDPLIADEIRTRIGGHASEVEAICSR